MNGSSHHKSRRRAAFRARSGPMAALTRQGRPMSCCITTSAKSTGRWRSGGSFEAAPARSHSRSVGVALVDGTELRSRAVVSNAHPKITFCELVDSSQLPSDFVRAIDRYKSRSGTVKVNLALGELPRFDGLESEDSMTAARSFIQLCDSMEYLEHAF